MSAEQGAGGERRRRKGGVRRLMQEITESVGASPLPVRASLRSPQAVCAVTGWGAVSPAGWSAGALREALVARADLPVKTERRCEGAPERRFRIVPAHPAVPDWMRQPRFRRTTAVGRHAVHAAVEALGENKLSLAQGGGLRVGVVFCTMNGCVQFSRRFYTEVQDNPALASPILFPETVYNAPASHLAALLGSHEINYTLVGDSAQFVAGLGLAAQWLEDDLADACLVVAAEEIDWLSDEALRLFGKTHVAAEGAAAVLLEPRTQENDSAPVLQHLTNVCTYTRQSPRRPAARSLRLSLEARAGDKAALFDGLGSGPRADAAERAAWSRWKGEHISVRKTLGEGFSITSGWQTVAALEWLSEGRCRQSLVSAVGLTQQAAGAVFGVDARIGVPERVKHEPLELAEHAKEDAMVTGATK